MLGVWYRRVNFALRAGPLDTRKSTVVVAGRV